MKTIDKDLARKIVDANVEFYADAANTYDAFHACTKSATQERYAQEIGMVLARLPTGTTQPVVLDAATGTGSLAFLFAERGCRVVGLDVSAAMLGLLRQKIKERQLDTIISLVESEVDTFLERTSAGFDVIAFGSALHHFPNYARTVGLAARRLNPGGALYIGLEPVALASPTAHRLDRRLCRLDYVLAMLIREPTVFAAKVSAKLIRPAASATSAPNIGALAEFHVDTGVDKDAVLAELKHQGLTDISVIGRYGGKHRLIRLLKKLLVRQPDEFSLLASKPNTAPASR